VQATRPVKSSAQLARFHLLFSFSILGRCNEDQESFKVTRDVPSMCSCSPMDIAYILQGFFLLAASTIVFVNAIEALQSRFLAYGARASIQEPRPLEQQRWLMSMLDRLARLRVPHKWFIHFYIVSVLSSVFWLQQLLTRGVGFQLIGSRMKTTQNSHSMSFNQVFLCSALLMAQGARRLMESISLAKPSQSRMWFVHWLLGIGFYIAMGVGVWIEGRGTLS